MIGLRESSYYSDLSKVKNVLLVNHTVDSLNLINDGEIVFTIVGTPALEAMFVGKPAIMFGDYAFAETNTISLCKDITSLSDLIRAKLDEEHSSSEVEKHSMALLAAKYMASRPGQIPIAEELIEGFIEDIDEVNVIKQSFKEELIARGIIL